jgi:hypothetical protein
MLMFPIKLFFCIPFKNTLKQFKGLSVWRSMKKNVGFYSLVHVK